MQHQISTWKNGFRVTLYFELTSHRNRPHGMTRRQVIRTIHASFLDRVRRHFETPADQYVLTTMLNQQYTYYEKEWARQNMLVRAEPAKASSLKWRIQGGVITLTFWASGQDKLLPSQRETFQHLCDALPISGQLSPQSAQLAEKELLHELRSSYNGTTPVFPEEMYLEVRIAPGNAGSITVLPLSVQPA